ncbi:hypothetical protein BABINDRAFT_163697 [Babjeviella inositovora NRRL Y-12698]|uniref:T-complex protein 1 subunit eta n=1 Tax=Babjeviella inositovora NRRL Y-12698 TaxID=984486 RepID=A0A1E3QHV8_9ASCO|nr:uncharacterized protein BABINDRAFT_163697 [Babjeviella inositovora NRRL Y-12698]ODQ77188.1 hypothetical protein BABINDRAFT_163697 [Babjeviella inositovora NRRL Y-12698]
MNSTPTVVVLKEGTDASQGRGQIISNINACLAIQDTLKPTLGPLGSDILIVNSREEVTITNDGATILKLLDVVHPAAKILVDIARAQDAEVGDGTTTVTLLASELLKESKQFIEENISSHIIVKGYRRAVQLAIEQIKALQYSVPEKKDTHDADFKQLLKQCASTAMSSKIINSNAAFFTDMVVDAVLTLGPHFNPAMVGWKTIPGGGMTETRLVKGVAFKKTFSYAGFEQQPKYFTNPKVVCLNVELELKAEKDNAEIRLEKVSDYQNIVDAEWTLIFQKLEKIVESGAQVVLSQLPIGDLATQYFADRGIFCAGRVPSQDMQRLSTALDVNIHSTVSSVTPEDCGVCGLFQETQIGAERYNLFTDIPDTTTVTFLMRGGAAQQIAELERSLNDALQVVKRTLSNSAVVAGGGAIEMELSKHIRDFAKTIPGKQQLIMIAFARALEVIPRTLADNAGLDSTEILNKLRSHHAKGDKWFGVDLSDDANYDAVSVGDLMEKCVWEPAMSKINSLSGAVEAACLILSVDETVKNQSRDNPNAAMAQQMAGRGRGMPQ